MLSDNLIILSIEKGYWRQEGYANGTCWSHEGKDGATVITDELLESGKLAAVKQDAPDLIVVKSDSVGHISHKNACRNLVLRVLNEENPQVICDFLDDAPSILDWGYEGVRDGGRRWSLDGESGLCDKVLAERIEKGMEGVCPARLIVLHEQHSGRFELYMDKEAIHGADGEGGFYFLDKENPPNGSYVFFLAQDGKAVRSKEEVNRQQQNNDGMSMS